MSAATASIDSSVQERAPGRSNDECRSRADTFLTGLIGARPDGLRWDPVHKLQGHAQFGRRDLVVIAPRDPAHETVVLSAEDWDEIRRATPDHRPQLLRRCSITNHECLVALLTA